MTGTEHVNEECLRACCQSSLRQACRKLSRSKAFNLCTMALQGMTMDLRMGKLTIASASLVSTSKLHSSAFLMSS